MGGSARDGIVNFVFKKLPKGNGLGIILNKGRRRLPEVGLKTIKDNR
ncbi:MAG: hypothetical protein OEY01_13320 [Desulfobulbaceae bacterium]|nr:hypothetical protein [Desulfobulbaceae bacterium]